MAGAVANPSQSISGRAQEPRPWCPAHPLLAPAVMPHRVTLVLVAISIASAAVASPRPAVIRRVVIGTVGQHVVRASRIKLDIGQPAPPSGVPRVGAGWVLAETRESVDPPEKPPQEDRLQVVEETPRTGKGGSGSLKRWVRPLAHDLHGEKGLHVYQGGKLYIFKRAPRAKPAANDDIERVVVSPDVQPGGPLASRSDELSIGGVRALGELRFDPRINPYLISIRYATDHRGGNHAIAAHRPMLVEAMRRGSAAHGEFTAHLDGGDLVVTPRGATQGLRIPRRVMAAVLAGSLVSVPLGFEALHQTEQQNSAQIDEELRKLLGD